MRAIRLASAVVVGLAIASVSARGQEHCHLATVPLGERTGAADSDAVTSVSADGRLIAFHSYVRLVAADSNDYSDVYVLDRWSGQLTLESPSPGTMMVGDSLHPSISSDGRLLVFESIVAFGREPFEAVGRQVWLRDRDRGTIALLTVSAADNPGNGQSMRPVISGNGRLVAFESAATNLVPGSDANGVAIDIYAVDLATHAVVRASVDDTGSQPPHGGSMSPSVSADGRYVAFASTAPLHHSAMLENPQGRISSKPQGATAERMSHVFVRDLEERHTILVSRDNVGLPRGPSYFPSISGNGRRVAYVSNVGLVDADRNRAPDVYLRDLDTEITTLVSRTSSGRAGNGRSTRPVISADGRVIAYQSEASDLECATRCGPAQRDINLLWDIFRFDTANGLTVRVSADPEEGWMEPSAAASLDATGRVLAFSSRRPIGDQDRGNDFDLFVRACEPSAY